MSPEAICIQNDGQDDIEDPISLLERILGHDSDDELSEKQANHDLPGTPLTLCQQHFMKWRFSHSISDGAIDELLRFLTMHICDIDELPLSNYKLLKSAEANLPKVRMECTTLNDGQEVMCKCCNITN